MSAKKPKPTTIGPTILLDLPKYGINRVPAKVDTGADSSSIWATSIHETNGVLSFTLFGPSSKFYTSQKVSTRDYEVISVKNSFGITQYRYGVRLAVRIGKSNLKVKFTLADRSRNNFPVLIGRRTLRGRFLVDVANVPKRKYEVLVLNTKYARTKDTEIFLRKVKKITGKDINFTISTYSNIKFMIDGKCEAELIKQKKSLSKFDLVYFKTAVKERDVASCVASYLIGKKTRFLNRAVGQNFSDNKLLQYILMANKNISVPRTLFFSPSVLESKYIEHKSYLGSPFILKDVNGKKGRDNYLIKNERDFRRALSSAKTKSIELIAQQYIPNDGDYRLLVLERQVPLIINRKASSGHVNNTSSGAHARLAEKGEVPGKVQGMAVDAALVMGLDIAGVDMVQDISDGNWYCLEVNKGPQMATGALVDEKVRAFSDFIKKQQERIV